MNSALCADSELQRTHFRLDRIELEELLDGSRWNRLDAQSGQWIKQSDGSR